ncbi:MAG: hypothetical protein ABJO54_18010 [Hyphomicrobiales bacterium]
MPITKANSYEFSHKIGGEHPPKKLKHIQILASGDNPDILLLHVVAEDATSAV